MRAVKTRHFLQLVLLSALWGASFLFIRVASPVLGPHVMAALRIGLATLTLMGIMRWAVIALMQAERHLSGEQPSLELALTGRMLPEIELDLIQEIQTIEKERARHA